MKELKRIDDSGDYDQLWKMIEEISNDALDEVMESYDESRYKVETDYLLNGLQRIAKVDSSLTCKEWENKVELIWQKRLNLTVDMKRRHERTQELGWRWDSPGVENNVWSWPSLKANESLVQFENRVIKETAFLIKNVERFSPRIPNEIIVVYLERQLGELKNAAVATGV